MRIEASPGPLPSVFPTNDIPPLAARAASAVNAAVVGSGIAGTLFFGGPPLKVP